MLQNIIFFPFYQSFQTSHISLVKVAILFVPQENKTKIYLKMQLNPGIRFFVLCNDISVNETFTFCKSIPVCACCVGKWCRN